MGVKIWGKLPTLVRFLKTFANYSLPPGLGGPGGEGGLGGPGGEAGVVVAAESFAWKKCTWHFIISMVSAILIITISLEIISKVNLTNLPGGKYQQ